ncbi:MAG: helix-turn-helix domain-containing protein [Pseudobdellovibrionaceae bacterium]|jgi:transcriptional regulator with XRE-family HTH domain|nr:helix-turn-helix domain-containing protein [Pseudobdellovibrionaceae bacterium]
MVSLITVSKAQKQIAEHLRMQRLAVGLTQEGLANRAGVSLPTLRKFEQKGLISLESFLKLMMALNGLEKLVQSIKPDDNNFSSLDDVLASTEKKTPKKGWRT